MIGANKGSTINEIIKNKIYDDCPCEKYIIDKKLYEAIYVLLRKVNINSKNIYGDLQG